MRFLATLEVPGDITIVADDVDPKQIEGVVLQGTRFTRTLYVDGQRRGTVVAVHTDYDHIYADSCDLPWRTITTKTTLDCILEL